MTEVIGADAEGNAPDLVFGGMEEAIIARFDLSGGTFLDRTDYFEWNYQLPGQGGEVTIAENLERGELHFLSVLPFALTRDSARVLSEAFEHRADRILAGREAAGEKAQQDIGLYTITFTDGLEPTAIFRTKTERDGLELDATEALLEEFLEKRAVMIAAGETMLDTYAVMHQEYDPSGPYL